MGNNEQGTKPRQRWWRTTKKRAQHYVDQMRAGVHIGGKKDGQELTATDKAEAKGYFKCLSDQAGQYKYNQAKAAGATKDEAAKYSFIIGKGGEEILEKARKRKK